MRGDERDWLSDWHEIQIETGSVHELASALRTEVYTNLQPHTERLFGRYAPGVTFGTKNPSADLQAVREKYRDCLVGTVDQLAAYINASTVLMDAAIEIASRYRTADALAQADVKDIDEVMNHSISVALGPEYGAGSASNGHPRSGGI
jgi:hypothetical protein